MIRRHWFFMGLGVFGGSFASGGDLAGWATEFSVGWESRYVSEGREEFVDGGLATLELAMAWNSFSFGVWSGFGTRVDDEEFNLTLSYGEGWRGLAWEMGYTRLELGTEGSDDEFFFGGELSFWGGFVLGVGVVYAVGAGGTFVSCELVHRYRCLGDRLLFQPGLLAGFDLGYRTAVHDGLNHLEVGLEVALSVTDRVLFCCFFKHSFAQTDVRREGRGGVSWAGASLRTSF